MDEDTLILYYYGDGLDDDQRAAVQAALEKNASLRERYRALCRSLDRLDHPPIQQAPEDTVARWHASIERAAARDRLAEARPPRAWHLPSFAWGALAAALVVGLSLGYLLGNDASLTRTADDTPVGPVGVPAHGESSVSRMATPVAFSRGLKVHLQESAQEIMRLPADDSADRTLLVMDIIRQNRMFERAARDNDAEDIGRVLRAIEPVLMRLATEDLSAEDAAELSAKLTFELNVVLTKMARRESDDTQSI